jgi:O-antigen/teichoic acid export membrane protein
MKTAASGVIGRNTAWMVAEQLARLSIAVLLTAWIARSRGPEAMGRLSFALALCALFGSVTAVGLTRIMVRLFSANTDEAAELELLDTAMAMRMAASALMVAVAIGTCLVIAPGNVLLVTILAPGYFATASDLVSLLYQSRHRSRDTVVARMAAFGVSSAIKAGLIWCGAGLEWIAVACLLDWVCAGVALSWRYRRDHPSRPRWRPSLALARRLFVESRIEIIAGFSAMAFMRIDQVMLEVMRDSTQVALMAVSTRLTEAWYFVPAAFVSSTFPMVVRMQAADPEGAMRALRRLYAQVVALGVVAALAMTFAAHRVVVLLYGARYAAAADVLVLQTWCGVFLSLGLASGSWLIANRMGMLNLRRNVFGMVVNVALNLWLIPAHGARGAAAATLVAFACAYTLYDFVDPAARDMGRQKLRAFGRR